MCDLLDQTCFVRTRYETKHHKRHQTQLAGDIPLSTEAEKALCAIEWVLVLYCGKWMGVESLLTLIALCRFSLKKFKSFMENYAVAVDPSCKGTIFMPKKAILSTNMQGITYDVAVTNFEKRLLHMPACVEILYMPGYCPLPVRKAEFYPSCIKEIRIFQTEHDFVGYKPKCSAGVMSYASLYNHFAIGETEMQLPAAKHVTLQLAHGLYNIIYSDSTESLEVIETDAISNFYACTLSDKIFPKGFECPNLHTLTLRGLHLRRAVMSSAPKVKNIILTDTRTCESKTELPNTVTRVTVNSDLMGVHSLIFTLPNCELVIQKVLLQIDKTFNINCANVGSLVFADGCDLYGAEITALPCTLMKLTFGIGTQCKINAKCQIPQSLKTVVFRLKKKSNQKILSNFDPTAFEEKKVNHYYDTCHMLKKTIRSFSFREYEKSVAEVVLEIA